MSSFHVARRAEVTPVATPAGSLVAEDLGVARATGGRAAARVLRGTGEPPRPRPAHRHDTEVLFVYVVRGTLSMGVSDQLEVVELQAGDCLTIGPGTLHELCSHSPDVEFVEVASPAGYQTLEP